MAAADGEEERGGEETVSEETREGADDRGYTVAHLRQ